MDLYNLLVLIIIAIIIIGVLFYVLKNIWILIINSILGLAILFIVNYFHLLAYLGKPDIAITPASVIICALGGVPGALILILLGLAGINV
jgi:SigmaK-factor processing regulatory protein BofA